MTFVRWAGLFVLGACASSPETAETTLPATGAATPRSEVDRILDEATLAQQESDVLFRRRFAQAVALRDGLRLEEALEAVDHALLLRVGDEQALALRDELRKDLGYRDGSVHILAAEESARYEVYLDEERLSVQRLIARARQCGERGDWDEARRNYEGALFILRASRFREDAAYRSLLGRTTEEAKNLASRRDSAEKERRDRETAAALRELELQESGDR